MRILFIGSTKRGYQTLLAMHEAGYTPSGIISLKQDLHEVENFQSDIRDFAEKKGIPFVETGSFESGSAVSWIRQYTKPDVGIVVGCRVLLPSSVYTIPKKGMYGVHDSLLPKYRGFAPVNWVILNGEKKTGVSLFKIGSRTDEGDLYGQETVAIQEDMSAPELYNRICEKTEKVVVHFLKKMSSNRHKPKKQNHSEATYGCPRIPSDGMIDWRDSSLAISRKILALKHPYPGAYAVYNFKKVQIESAHPVRRPCKYAGLIPGRIVQRNKGGSVDVLCSDGILRIEKVRRASGKVVPAADVFKSVKKSLQLSEGELFERIEQLELELKKK